MAEFGAPSFSLSLDLEIDVDLPESGPQSPIHAMTSRQSPSYYDDDKDAVFVETLVPDPLPPFSKSYPLLPPPSALGSWWELLWNIGDSLKETPSPEDLPRGSSHWISPKSTIRPLKSRLLHSDNLWEDISSKLGENLDTPAFDDFCGAYIRPVKDFSVSQGLKEVFGASSETLPSNCLSNERRFHLHGNNGQEDVDRSGKLSNSSPPAYRYFFHDNLSIQRLVRDRLRFFFPLGHDNPSFPSNCLSNERRFRLHGNNGQEDVDCRGKLSNSPPPAYRYFFHDSLSIQRLVRDRLHFFFPLGHMSEGGNWQSETSAIDYSSQFGQREMPIQVHRSEKLPPKENSKGKNKLNNMNVPVSPQDSGGWVNPRSSAFSVEDTRKFGLHIEGHSPGSGCWYTGHARTKESGVGFMMSSKKAANWKSSNKTLTKKCQKASITKRSNTTAVKKSVSKANSKKSTCKPANKKRPSQGSTSDKPAKKKRLSEALFHWSL